MYTCAHICIYVYILCIRFYGLHRWKPEYGRNVRFVVMNNVFATSLGLASICMCTPGPTLTHTYLCMYIYIYMYKCIYIYIYKEFGICGFVVRYKGVVLSLGIAQICIYKHIYTRTHTRTHIHTPTHTHSYESSIYICVQVYIYVCTCVHTRIDAYICHMCVTGLHKRFDLKGSTLGRFASSSDKAKGARAILKGNCKKKM